MRKSISLDLNKQEKVVFDTISHLSLDELMELQASLLNLLDQTNKRISFLMLLKKMRGN